MLNTVEREDFCLLFQTLTLTKGPLMQVKCPLSVRRNTPLGRISVVSLVGGRATSAAPRLLFLECFYS